MFGIPGGIEMLIFGAIVVVLFRKQVVEISRPLGQAVGQLRNVKRSIRAEIHSAVDITQTAVTYPATREVRICEASDGAADHIAAQQHDPTVSH